MHRRQPHLVHVFADRIEQRLWILIPQVIDLELHGTGLIVVHCGYRPSW